MKSIKFFIFSFVVFLTATCIFAFAPKAKTDDDRFITYTVNPKKQDIQLYLKNDQHENFRSIENLKQWLANNNKKLVFAMNAGMYKPDNSPQGLFIQHGLTLSPLDTSSGNGNFYLKPNGIFYISTNQTAAICNTADFKDDGKILCATQSGPMLVIDGQNHPAFKQGSTNVNIRNGVGILPDNTIVFAMSKAAINFYDFADYFKSLGCKNALYLDGFVSRTYLPEKNWVQTDGNFGVMVGVTMVEK